MKGNTLYPQRAAGSGCHVSKEIAFTRALTEAAQSRLTFISGARDDLFVNQYRDDIRVDSPSNQAWAKTMESAKEPVQYNDIPDFSEFIHFSKAIEFLLSFVLEDGISDAFALDLTDKRIGVPVVHVFAPFAEFEVNSGSSDPGARLCRFLQAQKQN